jgi:hypothetical protein
MYFATCTNDANWTISGGCPCGFAATAAAACLANGYHFKLACEGAYVILLVVSVHARLCPCKFAAAELTSILASL